MLAYPTYPTASLLLPVRTIALPAGWECELFGSGRAIVIHQSKAPNVFHRWMQRLFFGNVWKKT
jgi:hypothetical protein